jgi:hypothetical protein
MQGIYRYIPENFYVVRVCSFAAILYLQFVVHVMLFPMLNALYFHISTFRSTWAVPTMAVFRTFDFVPSSYVAQVLSEWLWDGSICPCCDWYHFFYTSHLPCISNVRSLCLKIFLASFLITFPSHEFATSINIHVLFSSLQIMMSGLQLGTILSVFNLLTSQYGCLTFMICFYKFWCMFIPVLIV